MTHRLENRKEHIEWSVMNLEDGSEYRCYARILFALVVDRINFRFPSYVTLLHVFLSYRSSVPSILLSPYYPLFHSLRKTIPWFSFSIPIFLSSFLFFFFFFFPPPIQTRWPGRQAITRLWIRIDLYSGSIFNLGIVPRNCPKNNLLLLSLYLPRLSGPGMLIHEQKGKRMNEILGCTSIKGNTQVAVPTFQGDIETDRRNRIVWHPSSI